MLLPPLELEGGLGVGVHCATCTVEATAPEAQSCGFPDRSLRWVRGSECWVAVGALVGITQGPVAMPVGGQGWAGEVHERHPASCAHRA